MSNMGVAAMLVGALATKEIHAHGNAVRRRIMGKITRVTGRTLPGTEVVLADRKLVEVMGELAAVSERTGTCQTC